MIVDWKEKLILEIDNYAKAVDVFRNYLATKKVEELMNRLIECSEKESMDENNSYEATISELEKALIESINDKEKRQIKAKITKLRNIHNKKSIDLIRYTTENEKNVLFDMINKYFSIAINTENKSIVCEYPLLMQLLALVGIHIDLGCLLECGPDGSFSKMCQQQFYRLVAYRKKGIDNTSLIDYSLLPYGINKNMMGDYVLCEPKPEDRTYYVLSKTLIDELLDDLNTRDFTSLADFSLFEAKKYRLVEITMEFVEFKRLYEETSEQILISDQRYYAEKTLEHQRAVEEEEREDKERAREEERTNQLRKSYMEEQNRQEEIKRQDELERERIRLEDKRISESRRESERYGSFDNHKTDNSSFGSNTDYAKQVEQDRQFRKQQEQILEAQYTQARAVLDAQIAQLRKEEFNLHGSSDGSRLLAVRSQLRKLEFERSKIGKKF